MRMDHAPAVVPLGPAGAGLNFEIALEKVSERSENQRKQSDLSERFLRGIWVGHGGSRKTGRRNG